MATDAQAVAFPWREDGLCGAAVSAPDGTQPARCNPWDSQGHTCCAADGTCVDPSTVGHSCTEYRIQRVWRDDGRCGADVKNAEGHMPAQCHPMHEHNLTCCSEEGWCGAWPSYAHCRCKDCVNYHAACVCGSPSAPCQDPASARCYPRTQRGDAPDAPSLPTQRRRANADSATVQVDSLGNPVDPQNLASSSDRRPDMDPRRSMRMVAIDAGFSGSSSLIGTSGAAGRRPVVDGMRCAIGLVDCASYNSSMPGAAHPAELGLASKDANLATAQSTSGSESIVATTASTGEGERLPPLVATAAPSSPPLPIRLAGGERPREGRVELMFNGTWGTVCGKGWGWTAAHVACRSLGFGGVESLSTSSEYGRGFGPVWLSHVDCDGNEPQLERCRYYGLSESMVPLACRNHMLDAGVHCSKQRLPVPVHVPLSEHTPAPAADDESPGNGQVRSSMRANDLASALDNLDEVLSHLERRRLIVEDSHIARLTRLRLRLRRLAGKAEESSGASEACACATNAHSPGGGMAITSQAEGEGGNTAALGIPNGLAARLPPDMLDELRRMPQRQEQKPLREARAEFEERQRLELFDPLADDPVMQEIRRKRENYEAPGIKPAPLGSSKPHERLRKPPIQTLTNRKPPSWQDAYEARYEHTMEQIRLGLAPEGIERTLQPGPWDHDPSFWKDPHAREVVLEHEFDEDIIFDY